MARNIWDVSDILLQQRAGDIQGNMFANLGQQIGAGFQQYGEIKKQNKAMEGEIGSTVKFLESARELVKNDPKRSAQIDQTLNQLHDPNVNLVQRYGMAKGSAKNIIDLVNLGEAVQQQNIRQQQMDQAQRDQDALTAYLNQVAPQLSGISSKALENIAPFITAASKAASPGRGQPKEFTTPSGRTVIFNEETGVFSVPPEKSAPQGYEWSKDASGKDILSPVRGGPIDIEIRAKQEAKEESRRQMMSTADNVIDTINNALPMVDELTAGFAGKTLSGIPGTKSKDLQNLITTIKSNVGFDRLQQMRQASPTGGALGQVAVEELRALQASIASLDQDQSPAQLRKNFEKVRKHYAAWRDVVQGKARTEEAAPNESKPITVDF